MEKRSFDREFVMEEILNGDLSNVKVDEPLHQHRWFTEYLLIFEYEGALWQTVYHQGHGDRGETPFEYKDTIDCIRVWERPVTSVEYVTEEPDVISRLEQEVS